MESSKDTRQDIVYEWDRLRAAMEKVIKQLSPPEYMTVEQIKARRLLIESIIEKEEDE